MIQHKVPLEQYVPLTDTGRPNTGSECSRGAPHRRAEEAEESMEVPEKSEVAETTQRHHRQELRVTASESLVGWGLEPRQMF